METRPVNGHFLSAENEISILIFQSLRPSHAVQIQRTSNPPSHPYSPKSRKSIALPSKLIQITHTNIVALNGGLWCSESQSNVLVPSSSALANSGGLRLRLGVQEYVRLLLERALRLHGKFGGHDCGDGVVVEGVGGWRWLAALRFEFRDFESEISNARLGLCATRDSNLPLNAKPKTP
jgi:hypothetical protein